MFYTFGFSQAIHGWQRSFFGNTYSGMVHSSSRVHRSDGANWEQILPNFHSYFPITFFRRVSADCSTILTHTWTHRLPEPSATLYIAVQSGGLPLQRPSLIVIVVLYKVESEQTRILRSTPAFESSKRFVSLIAAEPTTNTRQQYVWRVAESSSTVINIGNFSGKTCRRWSGFAFRIRRCCRRRDTR